MLRSKESTTRRAIDGGEKLGTSRSRGIRNGTRGAIMRRDLSGTLERGMSRKEKKKEEEFRVSGTQERNNYRIKTGVREPLREYRTQASARKDDGKLVDA